MVDQAKHFMTWSQRFAAWRWDIKWAFRCHYWWTTPRIHPTLGPLSNMHFCRHIRWHAGPHHDHLGLERPRKESNLGLPV